MGLFLMKDIEKAIDRLSRFSFTKNNIQEEVEKCKQSKLPDKFDGSGSMMVYGSEAIKKYIKNL